MFKKIADQLFSLKVQQPRTYLQYTSVAKWDSSNYNYAGYVSDLKKITTQLQLPVKDNEAKGNWGSLTKQQTLTVLSKQEIKMRQMPALQGMGLKDVVYLCENLGLKVNIRGRGKVNAQSISAGQIIARGQQINIQLN